MNAILSRSSPYTFPQASPRSHKRAAKASGSSSAPREARFMSDAALFRGMESALLTSSQCTASGNMRQSGPECARPRQGGSR